MRTELRSSSRVRPAWPLVLIAALLWACGESHDGGDSGTGTNGNAAGDDGAAGESGRGSSGSNAGSGGMAGTQAGTGGAGRAGSSGGGAGDSGGSGGAAGSPNAGAPAPPPDPDSCRADIECGFGEIEDEILTKRDCPCLLGCPYIPQNRETIERRREQYEALCEPGVDGAGQPCPIDDCVQMPDGVCVDGTCAGAR